MEKVKAQGAPKVFVIRDSFLEPDYRGLSRNLVPGFTDNLKYAVVAGAVTGGGLTVIANAPNPAGLSILKSHFGNNVSPVGLFKAALIPTLIMLLCFAVFR